MKYSVILPANRLDQFITTAVETTVSGIQKCKEHAELLIVINGPQASILMHKLRSYNSNKVRCINIGNCQNLGEVLNKGCQFARGKYLVRMDADDIWMLDRFDIIERHLTEEDDFLFFNAYVIDQNGQRLNKMIASSFRYEKIKLFRKCYFIHPTVVFKSEIFSSIGGYPELMRSEDYFFWIDSALNGFSFRYVDEAVIEYRRHPEQSTNLVGIMLTHQINFKEKIKRLVRYPFRGLGFGAVVDLFQLFKASLLFFFKWLIKLANI